MQITSHAKSQDYRLIAAGLSPEQVYSRLGELNLTGDNAIVLGRLDRIVNLTDEIKCNGDCILGIARGDKVITFLLARHNQLNASHLRVNRIVNLAD